MKEDDFYSGSKRAILNKKLKRIDNFGDSKNERG